MSLRCNSDDKERGAFANGHDGLFFYHTATTTVVNGDEKSKNVDEFTLLLQAEALRRLSDVRSMPVRCW